MPKYPIRLLVDIAIRALSPAVNDPTTAVQALNQIDDLLRRLGRCRLDVGRIADTTGVLRLRLPEPHLGGLSGPGAVGDHVLWGQLGAGDAPSRRAPRRPGADRQPVAEGGGDGNTRSGCTARSSRNSGGRICARRQRRFDRQGLGLTRREDGGVKTMSPGRQANACVRLTSRGHGTCATPPFPAPSSGRSGRRVRRAGGPGGGCRARCAPRARPRRARASATPTRRAGRGSARRRPPCDA